MISTEVLKRLQEAGFSVRRILIHGSCVSRDAMGFASADQVELVGYHARSSLASLASPQAMNAEILACIESPFQRRMVQYDMEKTFWSVVRDIEFDILLIDFIDERFNLVETDSGLVTESNEYRSAAGDHRRRIRITSGSELHFDLWKRGWAKLVSRLQILNKFDKVKINKVYWASSDGWNFRYTPEAIRSKNIFLDKLYRWTEGYLEKGRYNQYDDVDFVPNLTHKWGAAPFHFRDEFYRKTISSL